MGRKFGHEVSIETRTKISLANRGQVAWNKKVLKDAKCVVCQKDFKIKIGKDYLYKKTCSQECRYQFTSDYFSQKTDKKCIICNTNFQVSPNRGKAKFCSVLCYWQSMTLESSPQIERNRIRCRVDYKQWRELVLQRDNYSCIKCGSEESLQADHIKPFSLHPNLRLKVNNGRTLCKDCHLQTETYGFKIRKYQGYIQAV